MSDKLTAQGTFRNYDVKTSIKNIITKVEEAWRIELDADDKSRVVVPLDDRIIIDIIKEEVGDDLID